MRGVIHILEIVATGIMLLGSIAYFFSVPETSMDWSAPHFSTKAVDFFAAIENNGSIDAAIFDETEFVPLFSEYVSPMNFEISVEGAVEPVIRAACNCTLEEIHFLRSWLSPVDFNGRNVSFFLRRSNLIDLGNDDIIIICPSADMGMIATAESDMRTFLESGRGAIEIKDIPSGSFDPFQREFFGIQGETASTAGSLNMTFGIYGDRLDVARYFYNMPSAIFLSDNVSEIEGVECNPCRVGYLRMKDENRLVCLDPEYNSVYIDIDMDNRFEAGEGPFYEEQEFLLAGEMMKAGDIGESGDYATVVFPWNYTFSSFRVSEYTQALSSDKALVRDADKIPAVVINSDEIKGWKAVWMSGFNLGEMNHERQALLKALAYWASPRKMVYESEASSGKNQAMTWFGAVESGMFEYYRIIAKFGYW